MNRLLLATFLALIIHGLFFWPKWNWINKKTLIKKPQPITLDLTYLQHIKKQIPARIDQPKPQPLISPPKPKTRVKQTPPQPKNKPKPKPKPKPKAKPKPVENTVKTPSRPKPAPEPIPVPQKKEPINLENKSMTEAKPEPIIPDTLDPTASETRTLDNTTETRIAAKGPIYPAPKAPLIEAIPIYKKNPPPKYPRIAIRRGLKGTVLLEALINTEGEVASLRVIQSSGHPILDEAAEATVITWMFEPARRGDKPVEAWVTIPIRYELKE